MSGMTSQPNLNSIVAALAHTERDTGRIDGPGSALARDRGRKHRVRQHYQSDSSEQPFGDLFGQP
jgi:pyruvate carboxylase